MNRQKPNFDLYTYLCQQKIWAGHPHLQQLRGDELRGFVSDLRTAGITEKWQIDFWLAQRALPNSDVEYFYRKPRPLTVNDLYPTPIESKNTP